ncbi:MAG: response regulator, partial [Bacteroidota bacterium]
ERSEQAAALRDSQEQAKRQSTRLRALAGAFGQRDLTFMEHAESIFATALDLLGLDIGILSRIEDDCYTVLACAVPEGVPLAPGDTFVFSDTYCSITLQSDDVVAIDHMERSAHRRHPCYEAFGLETYIGAPITSGGVIIGTLNFSSPEARSQPFDESDLDLVRLMADWLGAAHQREAQARAIAEARDEAQAANRAKSAFLAAMSHEIRTPMNAVIGFGDLLSTTLLTPQQQSYVRTIQSAGDRLIGLIDDILDFSKIEAGRIDVETAPLELEPLVVGALEQIAPIAAQKGIELAYSIQDQITTRVEGDEQRISQILLNLLSNAIKFTERGSVEVHVRRASGGPYRLSVHDTGIGIPADRLEQVFDAFVQADSSTSRRFGGTGLGLAISQRLAERLGGELTATSTPGRGSVFTLELPLAAAPEAGRVVLTPASTPLRDIRVALVDDDEAGRLALVERMQGWGMEVSHTADPDELLGWLDDGADFDIGVLDMVMPGTDGLLLAEAIRQRLSAGELPLIVLSSERETRHAPGLVVSTALKPVMPATLHALLVRALDTRADESASTETALRILIAEDEPENQMLAVRMLRQLGFDAEVAGSGVEVLDRVRQHPYDVILMDVMMPEMDGLEATRRLRSEFPADQQPRIIALTARAMAADREACIAAGMDGYISKPFRLGTLAEALRQRLPTAEA